MKRTIPLALALSFTCSSASAHGLYRNGIDAESASLSGITAPLSDTPISALSGNSAGLMHQPNRFQTSMTFARPSGEFSNGINNGAELETGIGAIPAFAIRWAPDDSDFAFGFGITPDNTVQSDWQINDPGGFFGGLPAGTYQHFSELVVVSAKSGAAWRANDWLTLGAGMSLAYNSKKLRSPYTFQNSTSPTVVNGTRVLLDLETEGWGFNYDIGALAQVSETVTIGLTYQSPTWIYTDGTARVNRGVLTYDAEINEPMPQIVTAGVRWQSTERLAVLGQVDWVNYSNAFDNLKINLTNTNNPAFPNFREKTPLGWDDSFVGRVGLDYQATESINLRAGYTYGNNPVTKGAFTPMTAAINEQSVSAGMVYAKDLHTFAIAYQYDIANTLNNSNSSTLLGPYGGAEVEYDVHWLTLSYSKGF